MIDTMVKMNVERRFDGDLLNAGWVMINRCMMRVMTARAAAHLRMFLSTRTILHVMSDSTDPLSYLKCKWSGVLILRLMISQMARWMIMTLATVLSLW